MELDICIRLPAQGVREDQVEPRNAIMEVSRLKVAEKGSIVSVQASERRQGLWIDLVQSQLIDQISSIKIEDL